MARGVLYLSIKNSLTFHILVFLLLYCLLLACETCKAVSVHRVFLVSAIYRDDCHVVAMLLNSSKLYRNIHLLERVYKLPPAAFHILNLELHTYIL